jgi:hypothetical protein
MSQNGEPCSAPNEKDGLARTKSLWFQDEFGSRTYQSSVALLTVTGLMIITDVAFYMAGQPPLSNGVRFMVNVVIGAGAIGAVLSGAISLAMRFRIGAVVAVVVGGLEIIHFLAMVAL